MYLICKPINNIVFLMTLKLYIFVNTKNVYLFIAQILFPLKKEMVQQVGFQPTIFNYESGILRLNRLFFKNDKVLSQ